MRIYDATRAEHTEISLGRSIDNTRGCVAGVNDPARYYWGVIKAMGFEMLIGPHIHLPVSSGLTVHIDLPGHGNEIGITGIFSGGTEFTPQWTRYCVEELFGGPPEESGIYMTPTYGNTLMGLTCSKPVTAEEKYKISYYAPQPRAVTEVVEFDDHNSVVGFGETGRVKLTTLTPEFFVPGFLERDEGEREMPFEKFPWDGVSGVRPYHKIASSTTVGVY